MAVYTNLNEHQIKAFLELYDIGNLISFSEITEGIENSNFYVKTSKGNFILTIFEKRVNIKDIPFFIKIMVHLKNKGYYCPKPICDKNNNFLQELRGKPAIPKRKHDTRKARDRTDDYSPATLFGVY